MNIEVLFAEENIWLTQEKMAELFGTTPQNITQHLRNIYSEKEGDENSTYSLKVAAYLAAKEPAR